MTGEQMYEVYREERIQQGWQEFLWKSMSKPQQLVWEKVAQRLDQVPARSARIAAAVTPILRQMPERE